MTATRLNATLMALGLEPTQILAPIILHRVHMERDTLDPVPPGTLPEPFPAAPAIGDVTPEEFICALRELLSFLDTPHGRRDLDLWLKGVSRTGCVLADRIYNEEEFGPA